ncbi:MAG: pyridoxal-dependent decarboxylase [Ferruginibacter sp.]
MNPQLKEDLQNLTALLEKTQLHACYHLNNIDNARTTTDYKANTIKLLLPGNGKGGSSTLDIFNARFKEALAASAGPRYLGFVTGGATPASIMGDWLTAAYDQNPQAITGQGDVSAIIELETIDLLLQLLQLPNTFSGGFVTGATMSNFTCLALARQWAGQQQNIDIAKDGVLTGIKIFAATPHSSSVKSLAMLGIGSNNIIKVKTLEGNREAIDTGALEIHLSENKNNPCIVITSAGTVNTVDFDDMQAIAQLKKKYNFWWHIDAAFGAFAACSQKYAHLLTGWENADSIAVDCHKWLNVPYDSAAFFVKEHYKKLQFETFQNSNAPYLGDPSQNFSYLNFLPENSRRLRALPTWFSLMAYGKNGYRDIIENSIAMAHRLGALITDSNSYELLAPVRLNNVCFSLKEWKGNPAVIQLFLDTLNSSGKVFMTPTVYNGVNGLRAAFVNWRTGAPDIEIIFEEMRAAYAIATGKLIS